MKHAAERAAPNPFDVRAMWDTNGVGFGVGDKAYRAWFDGATRLQTEATTFWNGRLAKDMAALTTLGRCTDPTQAFETQMRYAREAMTDYYEEGQRMMGLVRDVAVESGMPMAGVQWPAATPGTN